MTEKDYEGSHMFGVGMRAFLACLQVFAEPNKSWVITYSMASHLRLMMDICTEHLLCGNVLPIHMSHTHFGLA